jgi:NAD(P)-dependent dehydrogenase (short-subunit alcohol dehydrogenase family)
MLLSIAFDDENHSMRKQRGAHVTAARICVVTGANRGIGREVAHRLAAAGDTVYLTARKPEAARTAVEELSAQVPGQLRAHQLDVTDAQSIARLARTLQSDHGRLDVLVNNAAILYDTWQSARSADLAVVREALETNLFGAWQTTMAMLPVLRASGHARVVNVSSEGGSLAGMGGGTPAYSVSKAALNALTRMLAAELRPDRILVNSVCPGWIATDMGGPGGRPVSEGAASVLWAVDLPDDGPTGGFYRHGRPLPW